VNYISQGINNATFTSSSLKKNDIVQVLMKSSATCAYPTPASSNILTMAMKDTSVLSVSISAVTSAACNGTDLLFTAIPRNAGPVSSYQWMVNGISTGTNSNTYNSSTLKDKDIIQCVLTSPAACRLQSQAYSKIITMTMPDLSISGDTFVVVGTKSHLTATTSYSGTDLQYQWQDSTRLHTWQDIDGSVGATIDYAPVSSRDKIRCIGKTYAGCMTISNSISIRMNVPTATPESPSVANGYRWYPNPVSSTLYIDDENRLDQISTIAVFNTSGIRVLVMKNGGRQEKITINVSSLPSGAYFVETRRKSGKTKHFQFLKVQ
jgi:hypothetical protein